MIIMPIFVEWDWQAKTKTFLVIFHFHDDFSRPNLRMKKFAGNPSEIVITTPTGNIVNPVRAWTTWAPSHPELGLLMELLSYANVINGLKEAEKRKLKIELQGRKSIYEGGVTDEAVLDFVVDADQIKKRIGLDKKTVVYENETYGTLHFCVELCSEYIDYLKEILKPYLKE
jgi:hypothetical protein